MSAPVAVLAVHLTAGHVLLADGRTLPIIGYWDDDAEPCELHDAAVFGFVVDGRPWYSPLAAWEAVTAH